jgi:lipopolysaccharide export system protein LptA
MSHVIRMILLCALVGLPVGGALAEKSDRSRPILIEADKVRLDDARKSAIYEGNVILSQGTLTLNADRLEVHQDANGMSLGEAVGQPVFFRQKMEGRDAFLEARAKRIEYDARSETMKLIGNAYINQGGDELRGGVIVYDVRSEQYQAEGASNDGKPGRVRAVIQPRNPAADSVGPSAK